MMLSYPKKYLTSLLLWSSASRASSFVPISGGSAAFHTIRQVDEAWSKNKKTACFNSINTFGLQHFQFRLFSSQIESEDSTLTSVSETEEAKISTEKESSTEEIASVSEEVTTTEEAEETSEGVEEVKVDEGFKVFIGNLPISKCTFISYDCDKVLTQSFAISPIAYEEDSIRALFEQYGKVTDLYVPRDRNTGSPRGFAFVTMADEEVGKAAIESINESTIEERIITCKEQVPKEQLEKKKREVGTKIYVGNLSFSTTENELMAYMEQFGTVADCFMPLTSEQRPRGFAFVTMPNSEEAETAIDQMNGVVYEGRQITVHKSLPRGKAPPPRRASRGRNTKIYVGNLPFDADPDEVANLFTGYGTVLDSYFPQDRAYNRSRGFGFITMASDEADEAINSMQGTEFQGRMLQINAAQPKGSRPRRNDNRDSWSDSGDSWDEGGNSGDRWDSY